MTNGSSADPGGSAGQVGGRPRRMVFRLLGPVRADLDGAPVDLGSRKQRLVLAVLLLEANRLVPAERLIDLLWPDLGAAGSGPADPRGMLYSYLSRLRSALKQAGADRHGVVLDRDGAGYLMRLDPDLVDVHRFRSLVRAAGDRDDDRERADLLSAALALWDGPALSSIAEGEARRRLAAGLDEARLAAQEGLQEVRLRLGEHDAALAELTPLVRAHPDRQRPVGLLMLALYRCGRPDEALAAYRGCRDRLATAGLDPLAELTRLELAILRDDPALAAENRAGFDGGSGPVGGRPRSGPGHPPELVGRDRELRELPALLAGHRLVTLTGAGGCGKTALARRLAADLGHRYRHGAAVLDLVAVTGIEQAAAALCTLLEVPVPAGGTPLAAVESGLSNRNLLLVLDTCEHLAAECGALCRQLAAACPGLTVLATSRQPLGAPDEVVWPLETLMVPDDDHDPDPDAPAVALFLARARAALPTAPPGRDELPDVARICRLLDGLPLAIELAAARVRTLPVADLARRLDAGLELLAAITPGADRRHHTLTATIDWSYRLLDEHERLLLARLSVFPGGFRLDDAEAVCGTPPLPRAEVPLLISRLVDRSLVQPYDIGMPATGTPNTGTPNTGTPNTGTPNTGTTRRFRLHHAVRLIAAERLPADERSAVAGRHLDRWLRRAADIDALPTYPRRVAAARAALPDLPDLRAALAHGYAEGRACASASLTARLLELWLADPAHVREGEQRLAEALRALRADPDPVVASRLRYHRAMLLPAWGDSATSLAMTLDLLADLARYWPREHLGARANILNRQRMLLDPTALASVPAALTTCATADLADRYPSEVRTVLTAAGWTLATWGRHSDAAELCRRYATIPGEPPSLSQLALRADIALRTGKPAIAEHLAGALTARLPGVPHPAELELPRRMVALVLLAAGRPEGARAFLDNTLADLPADLPVAVTSLLVLRAEAIRRCGHPDQARRVLADALGPLTPGPVEPLLVLPAVPAAALLAADLGDTAASTGLAAAWDALRRERGLPAPTGLHHAVASTLHLDPNPPPEPRPRAGWPSGPVHDLVDRARDWCLSDR